MAKIIKYKLTDQNLQTYNGFKWKAGVWIEAKGDVKLGLCTDAWLHCYDSPLLAILHNPVHANIQDPRLWEVECKGQTKNDNGIKRGYRRMCLVRELSVPEITTWQRVRYAILCAKQVYHDTAWNKWADEWLVNKNRGKKTADAARAAAYAADAAVCAADAAARAARAARAATYAARAAAIYAARAAARAACAAKATHATMRAAKAAHAADAAYEAAHAVDAVVRAVMRVVHVKPIDLVKLAQQAVSEESNV